MHTSMNYLQVTICSYEVNENIDNYIAQFGHYIGTGHLKLCVFSVKRGVTLFGLLHLNPRGSTNFSTFIIKVKMKNSVESLYV